MSKFKVSNKKNSKLLKNTRIWKKKSKFTKLILKKNSTKWRKRTKT